MAHAPAQPYAGRRADEVAKNMDGLTTYLNLVSVLIEEHHDGLRQAQRIADKYGAQVVGAIAPLNVYQLRLPVHDRCSGTR